MSTAYENVVSGKLRLKGKPLDVKSGGVSKKKKKHQKKQLLYHDQHQISTGGNTASSAEHAQLLNETDKDEEKEQIINRDDHLTPAERRYLQQCEKLDLQRMAKMASKSHRDRIQEFNQYLTNLTEHYDIPKVGPG